MNLGEWFQRIIQFAQSVYNSAIQIAQIEPV